MRVVQGEPLAIGSGTEKWMIMDHVYENFDFPNHKNIQARYYF